MNKKLQATRTRAIKIRETLSYETTEDQKKIAKLDKIIRGTVMVKWMHLIAAVFFIAFALVFMFLMYPDVKAMMIMAGMAACGYAVSWLGVFIQIKMYDHTIGRMGAGLPA
jgi:hypothetical protein